MSGHIERLTVGNVDFLDVERVKEGTDVLGGVVRNGTTQSVRQDPNPDSQVGVVAMSVLDGLHAWDIIVVEILLFLGIVVLVIVVLVILILIDLPVSMFVKPGKSNKVN